MKILNFIKKIKDNEVFKYLVVGGLTTLISMLVFYMCTWTILNASNPFELQIANIISWICSVTFAYITNRKIVFESKNKKILKEMISFYSSRLLTLFLDMIIMFIFVTCLSFNCDIMKIISNVLVIIGNYIISKIIIFRK